MASSFRKKVDIFIVEGFEKTLIGLSVDPSLGSVIFVTADHHVGLQGSGAIYLVI